MNQIKFIGHNIIACGSCQSKISTDLLKKIQYLSFVIRCPRCGNYITIIEGIAQKCDNISQNVPTTK